MGRRLTAKVLDAWTGVVPIKPAHTHATPARERARMAARLLGGWIVCDWTLR